MARVQRHLSKKVDRVLIVQMSAVSSSTIHTDNTYVHNLIRKTTGTNKYTLITCLTTQSYVQQQTNITYKHKSWFLDEYQILVSSQPYRTDDSSGTSLNLLELPGNDRANDSR